MKWKEAAINGGIAGVGGGLLVKLGGPYVPQALTDMLAKVPLLDQIGVVPLAVVGGIAALMIYDNLIKSR